MAFGYLSGLLRERVYTYEVLERAVLHLTYSEAREDQA